MGSRHPTIVSYTASAVAIAASTQVRFENKKILLPTHILGKTLCPTTTLALYVVVNSEVVGLAPDYRLSNCRHSNC
jgi:hypothetical protein